MKVRRLLLCIVLLALAAAGSLAWWALWGENGWLARAGSWGTNEIFLVEPYVQLGEAPKAASPDQLSLLWIGVDQEANWSVELRTDRASPWSETEPPTVRRVEVEGPPAFRLGRAVLKGLTPGG